jgi:hypothetical protein
MSHVRMHLTVTPKTNKKKLHYWKNFLREKSGIPTMKDNPVIHCFIFRRKHEQKQKII